MPTATSAASFLGTFTYRNDNARDGVNPLETVLTPANVTSSHFGKLFSAPVDGDVYAEPLYVANVAISGQGTHNVVYVATEHDSVYALDADNGAQLWFTSFLDPAHGITTVAQADVSGCSQIVPEIGITATPVIAPSTNTLYLVAMTKENGAFFQRLHALDITTGAERPNSPMVIAGSVSGTGGGSTVVTFNALLHLDRNGLLYVGGPNARVYIAFASHCDIAPYHGWVMAYDAVSLVQTTVFNTTPNGGLGGIWQSGGGLASDSSGAVYAETGNGTFDADSGGVDFGDSFIRLDGSSLALTDFFTPFDQQKLSLNDLDLGSGAPVIIDSSSPSHPNEIIGAGKEGTIYVIDRNSMGHFHPGNDNQIVQSLPGAIGAAFSTPAFSSGRLYYIGASDVIKSFGFSNGILTSSPTSQGSDTFGFPGASPVVSSNAGTNGIVWALRTDAFGSGPVILYAYDALDVSNKLYDSTQAGSRDNPGIAVKFTVPTVANGKVYVGAVRQLSVFGLLP
jgi:outer membrane protein assembly factor BamB